MDVYRLILTITFGLTVTPAVVSAESVAHDGAALVAQCATRDWITYINCQLTLLDIRAAGSYCVPRPENAARYQYEFLVFMKHQAAELHSVAAEIAVLAYFDHAYACLPPATSRASR
jgi:hypothetical protein